MTELTCAYEMILVFIGPDYISAKAKFNQIAGYICYGKTTAKGSNEVL